MSALPAWIASLTPVASRATERGGLSFDVTLTAPSSSGPVNIIYLKRCFGACARITLDGVTFQFPLDTEFFAVVTRQASVVFHEPPVETEPDLLMPTAQVMKGWRHQVHAHSAKVQPKAYHAILSVDVQSDMMFQCSSSNGTSLLTRQGMKPVLASLPSGYWIGAWFHPTLSSVPPQDYAVPLEMMVHNDSEVQGNPQRWVCVTHDGEDDEPCISVKRRSGEMVQGKRARRCNEEEKGDGEEGEEEASTETVDDLVPRIHSGEDSDTASSDEVGSEGEEGEAVEEAEEVEEEADSEAVKAAEASDVVNSVVSGVVRTALTLTAFALAGTFVGEMGFVLGLGVGSLATSAFGPACSE